MARKQISQTEAYRLKRRVEFLEDRDRVRFNQYRAAYPGAIHARTFNMSEATKAALDMAAKLGCALVAKIRGGQLDIYAVPRED